MKMDYDETKQHLMKTLDLREEEYIAYKERLSTKISIKHYQMYFLLMLADVNIFFDFEGALFTSELEAQRKEKALKKLCDKGFVKTNGLGEWNIAKRGIRYLNSHKQEFVEFAEKHDNLIEGTCEEIKSERNENGKQDEEKETDSFFDIAAN